MPRNHWSAGAIAGVALSVVLVVTRPSASAATDDAAVEVTVAAVADQLDSSTEVQAARGGGVEPPIAPTEGVALGELTIALPGDTASDNAVVRDGVSIYDNDTNDTAVAVNPTSSGVQILTSIGGPDSPNTFAFPFEGASYIEVAADGSATVYDGDGKAVASVAAPWATDAAGEPVPTHYEVSSDTLIQVVEHTDPGVEYPVLADPNIFMCDAWTHICVKFTKSETRSVASWTEPGIAGAAAFANNLCGKITGGLPKVACEAFVSVYAVLLSRSFNSAASNGKCVELHFPGIAGPFWWKTKGC